MTPLSTLAAATLIAATGLGVMASTASAAQYGHQQPQFQYQQQPQVQLYVQRHRHHRHDFHRFDHRGPQPQFYTQYPPQPQFYNQYAPPPPPPAYRPAQNIYSPPDAPWLRIIGN